MPGYHNIWGLPRQIRKSLKCGGMAGSRKQLWLLTGVSLWHRSGLAPVPIRWVLVVDPQGQARTEAFFSTDINLAAETIVAWFVARAGTWK
jgi:hypothetical protein